MCYCNKFTTLQFFFSCKDPSVHREFKNQCGAATVYYHEELSVLVVLVSTSLSSTFVEWGVKRRMIRVNAHFPGLNNINSTNHKHRRAKRVGK